MILTKTNSYLTLVFSLTRIAKSGVPLDSYIMHHGTVMCKKSYRKVASSNTSRLEAYGGFFRLLMKGIFYRYVL